MPIGIVKKTGNGVSKFKVGDEVTFGAMGKGAFSDFIVVDERAAELKPSNLTFEKAAAFQTAYLTAYVSLVCRGDLKKGETLLVHGSTGGVGMAAVQLGKYLGAKVIATGTSEEKLALTKEWGADQTVLTHKNGDVEFRQEVKDLTEGKGADVIYDPVGGDVLDESTRCINFDGRLLIIGFTSGRVASVPTNIPLIKGFSVMGVRAGEYGRQFPEKGAENLQIIWDWVREGKTRPHVHAELPLSQSVEGFRMLQQREVIGKLVICPDR